MEQGIVATAQSLQISVKADDLLIPFIGQLNNEARVWAFGINFESAHMLFNDTL